MKQNTSSNDEHELEKEIFKEKARQLPYNDSLGYLEEELKGFKQGYANAISDVEKIVDNWYVGSHSSECMADVFPEADLIRLKQEIARLKGEEK